MSIRMYLFILFIIFTTSSTSVVLLYLYMNPLSNPGLSLSLMGIGTFLMSASFLSPLIYFFKKVYYRGDVSRSTMNSSIRQWILITASLVFFGILNLFKITEWQIFAIAFATILCIEVMFQALD